MTDWILDASAVLAYFRNEPGADIVAGALSTSIISAVNAAEVVTKLIRYGSEPSTAMEAVRRLNYAIVPVDAGMGLRAGELSATTHSKDLSLGDRICLALAEREGLTVLTSDRAWLALGMDVKINLIR